MVMQLLKGSAVSLSSRELGLVYLISNFAQFHDPLYKSRWTFRHQFLVLENRLIRQEIWYSKMFIFKSIVMSEYCSNTEDIKLL